MPVVGVKHTSQMHQILAGWQDRRTVPASNGQVPGKLTSTFPGNMSGYLARQHNLKTCTGSIPRAVGHRSPPALGSLPHIKLTIALESLTLHPARSLARSLTVGSVSSD